MWPVLLVDDDGWIDLYETDSMLDIEEPWVTEVVAIFDSSGFRFNASFPGAGVLRLDAVSETPDFIGMIDFANNASRRWAPGLDPLPLSATWSDVERRVDEIRRARKSNSLWGRIKRRLG